MIKIKDIVYRNEYGLKNLPSKKNRVNLEAYPIKNVGDTIGPIVAGWLLDKKGIDPDKETAGTKHLLSVGSVITFGRFDAVVWGSGIRDNDAEKKLKMKKRVYRRKLDVRAVRGPLTRKALQNSGYSCPEVYGDPAILMPLIYTPENAEKKYDISVILHHETAKNVKTDEKKQKFVLEINDETVRKNDLHFIDPKTEDHKSFIDEIAASRLVISSSLHGIIFAEAYGVPAVFLNTGVEEQNVKFNDWYLSTGREMIYCKTLEEALAAEAPALPELDGLREKLIENFPYDMWD